MIPPEIRFGEVRIQLVEQNGSFAGIGAIWIGKTQVRSAALPLRPFAETLFGLRFDAMEFLAVTEREGGIDIHAKWLARDSAWEVRLDHSLDRILNTAGWDRPVRASAEVTFVFRPSTVTVGGRSFSGFSYAIRYESDAHPIHLIVDRSTWELDGRISGCTYYGQLNFQPPVVRYSVDTAHSSEGTIDFPLNPVMTHAMPRWAGAPTVDYLFKDSAALVLFYERVSLIRSVMKKTPGEDHLKFFEQHYLDYGSHHLTSPRLVLLDMSSKTEIDHKNLWTRWQDLTANQARAEFGMPEPEYPTVLSQNLWENFTFESYEKNLLPAAKALNYGQVFIDPIWENDMTKRRVGALVNPGPRQGNMCCPWEYEVAKVLGGEIGLKALVDRFHAAGVQVSSWIGTHLSDLFFDPNATKPTCISLADGRHQYGSGYDTIIGMDLNSGYDDHIVDRLRHVRQATGIDGFLYDSFYNFGFMPVSFQKMQPRTQARKSVELLARLAANGLRMRIESLGPFGQPSHGVGSAYNDDENEFIRYKGNFSPGHDSSAGGANELSTLSVAEKHFRLLSGKSQMGIPLFVESRRIDSVVHPLFARANAVYRQCAPHMGERDLLSDGSVQWRSLDGKTTTLWCCAAATLQLPADAVVRDLSVGGTVKTTGDSLRTLAYHVYQW